MQQLFLCIFRYFIRRRFVFFLAIIWILSVISGAYLSADWQNISVPMMRAASQSRVSIVSLIAGYYLPFILSAVAIYFSIPRLLYIIAAWKGICFSFCAYSLLAIYTDAVWLMFGLICFHDVCVLMPLFLFWICHIDGNRSHLLRNTARYVFYAAICCIVEYIYILPLVSTLITN